MRRMFGRPVTVNEFGDVTCVWCGELLLHTRKRFYRCTCVAEEREDAAA